MIAAGAASVVRPAASPRLGFGGIDCIGGPPPLPFFAFFDTALSGPAPNLAAPSPPPPPPMPPIGPGS